MITVSAVMLYAQEKNEQPGEQPQKKKALIAYEETRFKSSLVKEMTALLEKASVAVTVVKHSDNGLDKQDPSGYDAVFITNSGVNSKVRPWVMAWLKKHAQQADKILLHTTQRSTWEVKAPVDGVTSASANKKVKEFAAEYVRLLKAKYTSDKPAADDDE